MTFIERNQMIVEAVAKYMAVHKKYTSSTAILTDDEWQSYVNDMDAVAEEYKLTNMTDLSWKLCMAFLDDTELMQKKLKEVGVKA